ncbi:MAG: hypothetical protein JJE52_02465 [Acidimicrobiia bacterium]|nr:hypothetical protein [Acidimicrobiia bacterium]
MPMLAPTTSSVEPSPSAALAGDGASDWEPIGSGDACCDWLNTKWVDADGVLISWSTTLDAYNDPDGPHVRAGVWVPPGAADPAIDATDPEARATCPVAAQAMRIGGGRLVAGFDATVGDVEGLTGERPEADDDLAVVCWYEEATFSGGMDTSATTTGAYTVYIGGELVHAATTDRPPRRP